MLLMAFNTWQTVRKGSRAPLVNSAPQTA